MRKVINLLAGLSLASLGVVQAQAQNLPPADPPFKGTIGSSIAESKPDFPRRLEAPTGVPNILIILLDDVGFGQFGTFGGLTPTPAMDKIAAEGVRFNQFHTAALCSPTRAALLTGRNPHACGAGVITELATGFPGYNNVFPRSCTTIARVLRDNGYATAMFGKNHNTPAPDASPAGPFTQWPTGMGFDYFLGFNQGDTSWWDPNLIQNTRVYSRGANEKSKHLTELLVDHTIDWIAEQKSIAPDRPFFAYLAPGATHAPHHVAPEWIAKFKGRFDMGWDKYREMVFARQLKLGVIPKGTKLTPRPPELPAWNGLSPDEKRLYARMMEVFAGFTAHTDHEVGRLLDALDKSGQRDNTLIFYVVGDNGASAEGGEHGSLNEIAVFNGVPDDLKANIAAIDELGGNKHFNHFPSAWGWAMNTPFQWTKQVASHFGGTRNPLVVSWPKGIADRGGLRSQFHYIADIAPTIMDVVGIKPPETVDGVAQKPFDGISMAYSFPADARSMPSRRTRQVFEMFVNRAIYDNGWVAANKYSTPWIGDDGKADPESKPWELYNISADFSQANNLAAKDPERLKAMQQLWNEEAAKGQILPLDTRRLARFATDRPNWGSGRSRYIMGPETVELTAAVGPVLRGRSYTIRADIEASPDTQGVIVAQGGNPGGWSLYVKDGIPIYSYNFLGIATTTVTGSVPLKSGANVVTLEFAYDGGGMGKGGMASLAVNGVAAGSTRIARTIPMLYPGDGFDVGDDRGSPVVEAYRDRATFTGKVAKVTFDLK